MASVFWVALGGATGAAARFWVNQLFARNAGMLVSTLTVNVLGCILLGFFFHWFSVREVAWWTGNGRTLLATGFCGAFTTMSALALEVHTLSDQGQTLMAGGYALLNVSLSIAGLAVGVALARYLL